MQPTFLHSPPFFFCVCVSIFHVKKKKHQRHCAKNYFLENCFLDSEEKKKITPNSIVSITSFSGEEKNV